MRALSTYQTKQILRNGRGFKKLVTASNAPVWLDLSLYKSGFIKSNSTEFLTLCPKLHANISSKFAAKKTSSPDQYFTCKSELKWVAQNTSLIPASLPHVY